MRKRFTKKERRRVWKKHRRRCAYCGCLLEYKDMQIDHIIPVYRYSEEYGCIIIRSKKITAYGLNDFENLNPACTVCNKWKSSLSLEEFRHEIQMQVSRLNKRSAGYRMALKYKLIKQTFFKVEFYFEILAMIK